MLLRQIGADRFLPIWCGESEAAAIASAQQGSAPAPPLTHDLFAEVLTAVVIRLLSADITSLRDGIINSDLVLPGGVTVSA